MQTPPESVCTTPRRDQPAMAKSAIVWLMLAGTAAAGAEGPTLRRFERTRVEMAAPVRLLFYANDEATANRAAEAAFSRIRQLNAILSDYDPQSELRQLCATAGDGTYHPLGDDLWRVLVRAQEISRASQGAFDVTVGPVVRLWRRARRQHKLPKPEQLEDARRRVGWTLVELDPKRQAVRLVQPGMRLDLGGIAKGYAADAALAVLAQHGITRALVDAGGDISLGSAPPSEPGWRIGVARLEATGRRDNTCSWPMRRWPPPATHGSMSRSTAGVTRTSSIPARASASATTAASPSSPPTA